MARAVPDSLRDLLADALPKDAAFTFYHYSTPPSNSPSLFSAPPSRKPERTFCESHLLAATIAPSEELLVLAIEALVYSTKNLTTIFVSKADSTGYLSALGLPHSQGASPLKTICGTFVAWLARNRQREGKTLVVSLFARAQDQYLFPASIENKNKHVLDDRLLVKWWCRVLDPLVNEYATEEAPKPLVEQLAESKDHNLANGTSLAARTTAKGYLVIPGFDLHDTLRYLPSPSAGTPRRWAAAHPLLQIAPHPGGPPRTLVPHFPDDPKSRFLDELDEELPDKGSNEMTQHGGTPSRSNGQWKSVKTLDQFWETMAFRQECSSGRIVGFIWVVIKPPHSSIPEEEDDGDTSRPLSQNDSQNNLAPPMSPPKKKHTPRKPRRRQNKTLTGPIPLRLPRIKSSTSNLSINSSVSSVASTGVSGKQPLENTAYYAWPSNSRGTIVFSSKDYDRAHEILLGQSFAAQTAAARSTKRWISEIAVLGGVESWGWTVVGKKEATSVTPSSANGAASITVIGVRKKRKPGDEAPVASTAGDGIQTLGEALVRKKAKVDTPPSTEAASAANEVNTLGEGLVRKKPKK
ncbi:DNA damage response protein-like protein [Polyplosphaeria fusca]|uniref:histone acetyltransferase n=1 Tax=Polyplosphaeria fusca TaxID=682080 RepID=A0A9P4QMV0_9PLEO|nr:DNA damage response protein-like protein [Polyplosphaeria fusca]